MRAVIKWVVAILFMVVLFGQSVEAKRKDYVSDEYFESIEDVRPSRDNSILTLIFEYQKNHEKFLRGLQKDDNYYGCYLSSDLLENAFYKGRRVSFRRGSYVFGQGKNFELIDAFVNESGTEVIIFATRGGQKYVFQSTEPCEIYRRRFDLELTKDPLLSVFMNENSDNDFESIVDIRTAKDNSILTLMLEYQKNHEKFIKCKPMDKKSYYGWQSTEHLLNNVFYNNRQISFRWGDYSMGQGEQYELIETFVNESGTELIIFAIKEGHKYVFHSTEPSYPEYGGLSLDLTRDTILKQFMEEQKTMQ
ncbi:hypothetical protein JXA27_07305 [Aerococcaceae bacterium zg-B36]|uniref:hypothetical protein n=1 Tax=Aerococcaceae bacterium zg-252 TaxID=2796928 RepID=UPI001BD8C553|nr:hypothetical protein [Aerococcaceae bacterium zg-B36]